MKLNIQKYVDDHHLVGWFVCTAIGDKGGQIMTSKMDSRDTDVELRIQGVEVSLVDALNELSQQHEKQLCEARKEGRQAALNHLYANAEKLLTEDTNNDR